MSNAPLIQPMVASARIGPNSFLASFSRASTSAVEMVNIGA